MGDLYTIIKDTVKDLADALVHLPKSHVWVHEKALYNIIGIKRNNTHGKREVLTYLLKGIQKGLFGNKQKKNYVSLGYSLSIPDDSHEKKFDIACQQYGNVEEFLSGTLDNKTISGKPRWFRSGNPITDVKTQIEIVNALIGEEKGLPADVATRRRQYYKRFVSGEKNDGGYRRYDVPTIIGEYEQIWLKIVGAKSNTRNGAQQRYELEDRQKIEDILKLMIVASNTCGKLKVEDGLLMPSKTLRRGRGDGLDSTTAMPTAVTPAAGKTNAAAKPTPKAITFTPDVKEARGGRLSSRNNNDGALKLQYITCTNADGDVSMKKVSELASLELLFHLYGVNSNLQDCNGAAAAAERDMKRLNVKLPETFDYNNLQLMSSQQVNQSNLNIQKARINLVENLNDHFVPREDCLLYEWLQDGRSYSRGCAVQTTSNFQQGAYNKHQISITLSAVWILRHIVYSHNLPLRTALMLWAEYHVLILRRPIRLEWFICERTLWNHIHRLSFIDNALATRKFHSFIRQRSPNGFLRYFYSSSDDSKHNKQTRHVVLVSTNTNSNTNDIQPGFRHVTSSVNELKTNSAQHNAEQIISMLGLHCAAHYGGGTNDNAPDAQKEIFATFDKIMDAAKADEDICDVLYENGVLRRAIRFGDPYHIANLAVMWASEVAFGGTENADHTQVHHRQLLQSIHSLHTDDKPLSQAYLNEVMEALSFVIKSKRERQQRWLVNQRNARATLDMYYKLTEAGNSSLVEWALKFANESKSDWKRRVGGEIATWLSMPSIILGLHFESELGNYFEEIYAWHCRPGPLNSRPGFRMLELYDLYFGFEVPWWNEAVANPETKLPETMKYLEDNFHGDELVFRKSQIMRGLKKGRDEMIKMSSKYLLQPPIMFILLTHREYGGPFLRAVLAVLNANPVDGVVLIHDADKSSEWGDYGYGLADPDVKKWYDILRKHSEAVVHFWRQFRLDSECVVHDLKKLSKEVGTRPLGSDTAPLLSFKKEYPVLFECLHAVFGMMMSNSRLCEQIHGSLQHGLRSGTGMDFVDGQKDYEVSTGYNFRQERREMEAVEDRPTKRRKTGLSHNNTKEQLAKASEQLTEYLPQWLKEAEALLAEPAHGIPTVSKIVKSGRRVKDKFTFNIQFVQEKNRAAKLTREKLTVEKVKETAAQTNPSNDRILRLGDERLESRRRICEITRKIYWSGEFVVDGKRPNFKVIWLSAVKSFPLLRFILHHGPLRQDRAMIRNKSNALQFIGNYLDAVKKTTKLICEFAHGCRSNSSCDGFVPMRDRHFEQADLLEWMGFIKVVDISDSSAEIAESAALVCLSSFKKIEEHYTYTLSKSDGPILLDDQDDGEDVIHADEEGNNERCREDEGQGDSLRRSSRRKRLRNVRHLYPGEESSSSDEEEEEEDVVEDDDAPVPFT